jgi:hypothetical protein
MFIWTSNFDIRSCLAAFCLFSTQIRLVDDMNSQNEQKHLGKDSFCMFAMC